MLKTIIPGYYLVHSRLRASWERLSWILINPVVVAYIANRSANIPLAAFLPIYVLAFAAWTSVYEIGYLANDYSTVRRESDGSHRLSIEEVALLDRSYWAIITAKVSIAAVLLLMIDTLGYVRGIELHILRFLASLVVMTVSFYIHNAMRCRWNILSFFVLYVMKYTAITLLFSVESYMSLYAAGVLVIPIPRVIEYASKRRFELPWISRAIGNVDGFRVKYYLTGVVALVVCGWPVKPCAQLCLVVMIYMLTFRIGALVAASKLRGGREHCGALDEGIAA